MYKCILPIKNQRTRTGAVPIFTEGLYELSKGVYSWMIPNGSWGESNHGLITGLNESILVDTAWDINLTKTLLNRLAPIIDTKPINRVINTHGDGDHCWGNQLFANREIIASTATQQNMYHVKPEILQKVKKVSEVVQHVPIPRCKHFGQWFTHMLSSYDYKDVTITPATTTFDKEMTIQCEPHEVTLFEMESAHTNGDTLIYLPKEEILFSGDILFIQGTPVLWAGTADNWIDALNKIIELNPKTIVPGHGYFTDIEGVKALIDYWRFVDYQLKEQFNKGVPSVQAANNVALGKEFHKLGYHLWDSPERIVTSAMTLYKHWSKAPPSKPSTFKQLKMFSEQAELSFRLKKQT